MNWFKTPFDLIARVSAAVEERPACSPLALHIAATAWCAQYARDGIIPASVIATLVPWSKSGPRPEATAERLVEADLWLVDGGSFRLADFDFQATPVDISLARSEAGKVGGRRSGEARAALRNARIGETNQTKQTEAKPSKRSEERREEERREDIHTPFIPLSAQDSPAPDANVAADKPPLTPPNKPKTRERVETPKETGDRLAVTDAWTGALAEFLGDPTARATWDGPRIRVVKELLATHGRETCLATIRPLFFDKAGEYWRRNGAPDVFAWRRAFDGLRPRAAPADDRPAWIHDDPLEKMTEEERADFFKRESERVKYGRD